MCPHTAVTHSIRPSEHFKALNYVVVGVLVSEWAAKGFSREMNESMCKYMLYIITAVVWKSSVCFINVLPSLQPMSSVLKGSHVGRRGEKTKLKLQNKQIPQKQTSLMTSGPCHSDVRGRLNVKWQCNRRGLLPWIPRSSTRTAISRLISCESCSLETLNHSFSVLSWATSLATLTGFRLVYPTLETAAWRRGGAEI